MRRGERSIEREIDPLCGYIWLLFFLTIPLMSCGGSCTLPQRGWYSLPYTIQPLIIVHCSPLSPSGSQAHSDGLYIPQLCDDVGMI